MWRRNGTKHKQFIVTIYENTTHTHIQYIFFCWFIDIYTIAIEQRQRRAFMGCLQMLQKKQNLFKLEIQFRCFSLCFIFLLPTSPQYTDTTVFLIFCFDFFYNRIEWYATQIRHVFTYKTNTECYNFIFPNCQQTTNTVKIESIHCENSQYEHRTKTIDIYLLKTQMKQLNNNYLRTYN